jgi:hypothetical protein
VVISTHFPAPGNHRQDGAPRRHHPQLCCNCGMYFSAAAAIVSALKRAGVEFIDENGGGPGVRLRKRQHKKH